MSERKQALIATLSQGTFWIGDTQSSGNTLSECYFYGSVPSILKDMDIKQEKVYQHDTDDFSGQLYTIWKFTIPKSKKFDWWSKTYKEFPEEIVYIRFEGFYRSHEGSEYTDFREVKPEEKTIAVYE